MMPDGGSALQSANFLTHILSLNDALVNPKRWFCNFVFSMRLNGMSQIRKKALGGLRAGDMFCVSRQFTEWNACHGGITERHHPGF